jgi:hypothetical protein
MNQTEPTRITPARFFSNLNFLACAGVHADPFANGRISETNILTWIASGPT